MLIARKWREAGVQVMGTGAQVLIWLRRAPVAVHALHAPNDGAGNVVVPDGQL
ncbi:hypothetical protein [Pseudoxanthomonas mexicana]